MAAIDDLIAQVEDTVLRERLRTEAERITKDKKFGLVFEEHLPELTPIYNAKVRRKSKVALRDGDLTDLWRVVSIANDKATCRHLSSERVNRFGVSDLVVIRQFGEPIFPAIVPVDRVQNGPEDAPWHTLIEADNYHALQLLEYLYTGKVDCIYIDPPYNTGARDWKYNNDYVDKNDRWRHSKWLAMMRRRLQLAVTLLKANGIMIITIDDYEMHNLRALLADSALRLHTLGIVAIKNNPSGRGTVSGFAVSHEYAIFLSKDEDAVVGRLDRTAKQLARYKDSDAKGAFEWANFRKHGGATSYRRNRPRSFYPIYTKGETLRIPKLEWNPSARTWNVLEAPLAHEEIILPIDASGAERVWALTHQSAREQIDELTVRRDQEGKTGVYRKWRLNEEKALPSTWWEKNLYSSAEYGTNYLKSIFGETQRFTFPKSFYAVRDCLLVGGGARKDALIVDFFAGSGTTLNAILLLNAADAGRRRCILVTNNEVSDDQAKELRDRQIAAGTAEWEARGICRSVTWPRCRLTISGERDNGSKLDGEYLTGLSIEVANKRRIQHISFAGVDHLSTAGKKRQLVALIPDLPQSAVKKDSAFIVSDKNSASILFDETAADAWLEALEDADHVTDFYIVAEKKKHFDELKERINELLGPLIVTVEEKRDMSEGFSANLEFFRLDFLDKSHVALGRQFREMLPILWLRAGALGPRPTLPKNKPLPTMMVPGKNHFAILLDERYFQEFAATIADRKDLTHVFLVTDSEESFREMSERVLFGETIQLYRDYLENFVINKGGE